MGRGAARGGADLAVDERGLDVEDDEALRVQRRAQGVDAAVDRCPRPRAQRAGRGGAKAARGASAEAGAGHGSRRSGKRHVDNVLPPPGPADAMPRALDSVEVARRCEVGKREWEACRLQRSTQAVQV